MKENGNKYCQNVVKNLSKSCPKVLKKLSKSCQNVVKKLSKSCQKAVKKCQKVVKVVKKLYKFKTSGEDKEEEEEEDWWLQDQVATSSHLVKSLFGTQKLLKSYLLSPIPTNELKSR
jgi:uncharacterized membrane-anchored protein YhcB (DUF1043 family)